MSDVLKSDLVVSLLTRMRPERVGTDPKAAVKVGFARAVDLKAAGAWDSYCVEVTATSLSGGEATGVLELETGVQVGTSTTVSFDGIDSSWEGKLVNVGKVLAVFIEADAGNTQPVSYVSATDPAVDEIPNGMLKPGCFAMGFVNGLYEELPVPAWELRFQHVGDKARVCVVLKPGE